MSIFTAPFSGDKWMQIHRFTAPLIALVLGLTLTANAHAVIIDYSFSGGTASAGSSLDLGNGVVDISGAAFTATGTLLNGTDLESEPMFGQFAATTVYDFGALGAFETDRGADFYFQIQGNSLGQLLFFVGLGNSDLSEGLFPLGLGNPFATPNIPQAVGLLSFINEGFPTSHLRLQTNTAGQSLTIVIPAMVQNVNITASGQAPLPGTLPLMALALAALGLRRRT
jgi:uncharacterized protein (TIGR03382 family)